MEKKPIERACEKVGGQAALARAIGVHTSLPNQWVKGHRPIPAERCPDIERVTGGEVTCEELRPDLAKQWAYLRNSSGDRRHPSCGGRRATDEKAA